MQSYSLNGYLNAVLRRTNKTLLVEGITDQSVMTRLKLVKGEILAKDPGGEVDVAQLISDEKTAGLGKKQILHLVMQEIESLKPELSKRVKNKLGILTDREWDGVNLEIPFTNGWMAPDQKKAYFVTVGHSVENYFFRPDASEAYLRQNFFNYLTQNFFNALKIRFHQIVALAAIYSFELRHANAITRSAGAINRYSVRWDTGRYLTQDQLKNTLIERGVEIDGTFSEKIKCNIDLYLASHDSIEPGRWLCHGHLGEEAIWACIGNLALEYGCDDETARNIERGYKDQRFNHLVDYMARNTLNESSPLDEATEWLTSN